MASTDVDGLRQFIFETKFLDTYEIDPEAVAMNKNRRQGASAAGIWLDVKVMFQEPTITMKEDILQAAAAKARADMSATWADLPAFW